MARYINILSGGVTTTLIPANEPQATGNISSINICSNSAISVSLYLREVGMDSTDYNIIAGVAIPDGAALILEDSISFDITKYSLMMSHKSANISVIIK